MSRERNMDTGKEIARCDQCGDVIEPKCLIHAFDIEFDFLHLKVYREVCSDCRIELTGQISMLEKVFEIDRDGQKYIIRAYPPVGVKEPT